MNGESSRTWSRAYTHTREQAGANTTIKIQKQRLRAMDSKTVDMRVPHAQSTSIVGDYIIMIVARVHVLEHE